MLDNINIDKYYNVKSDIHTLNPLIKIICMLIFIISILFINDVNILFILFTFKLIIYFVTNIPFKIFFKSIIGLKYLIIFIILINIFMGISFVNTIILLIKIISVTLCANIFILTTTSNEILNGLNYFLIPLKKIGIKTEIVSLIISLTLQFIPITLEEAKRILKSLKIRGLTDDSDLSSKLIGLKSLIIPLYLASFRRADVLADIMELRLYSLNSKKTYKKINWNYLDISFAVIHVIIFVVVLKEVIL